MVVCPSTAAGVCINSKTSTLLSGTTSGGPVVISPPTSFHLHIIHIIPDIIHSEVLRLTRVCSEEGRATYRSVCLNLVSMLATVRVTVCVAGVLALSKCGGIRQVRKWMSILGTRGGEYVLSTHIIRIYAIDCRRAAIHRVNPDPSECQRSEWHYGASRGRQEAYRGSTPSLGVPMSLMGRV